MIEAKKFQNRPEFLSEKQWNEHNLLYNGYVNKLNEISKKMENVDLSSANATLSELRSLKVAETFALNGVKLHEGYFECVGPKEEPSNEITDNINDSFGSYERFEEEFKSLALAVRGWVILAYDLDEKKLKIFGADSHDIGVVWNCIPFLILDVYEHAYFIDYGTARKKYVENFMNHINWSLANRKINEVLT